MSEPSYAHVPEEGFHGFAQELAQGEWALVDSKDFEGGGQGPAKPLCEAPLQVAWKLRIGWTLAELGAARGGADAAKDVDGAWDGTQKKFGGLLLASHDKDPEKRAASARLQKAFLLGAGSGQTKLRYQQEVDFGRTQVQLAKEAQHAADIHLLGLDGVIAEIEETTDALADAIGHGQGTGRRPSERRRAALGACSTTFAAVADSIAWAIRCGTPGDQPRAQALLESLHALAKRYPAPASGTSTPADQTTSAAPSNEG
ncbi:hypothetical protein [Polyangium fumosum]|uniref:Uncharacterized protein n=1 Tax=Polyangium fumosum TaxID=889272 RepID=A0A4U1J8N1_9BACT|nr:hypothetical protein [Polyangium fumosum]TKD03203.1 hypothetical protein E8A74_27210 [Polyangium fumosum]